MPLECNVCMPLECNVCMPLECNVCMPLECNLCMTSPWMHALSHSDGILCKWAEFMAGYRPCDSAGLQGPHIGIAALSLWALKVIMFGHSDARNHAEKYCVRVVFFCLFSYYEFDHNYTKIFCRSESVFFFSYEYELWKTCYDFGCSCNKLTMHAHYIHPTGLPV